MRNGEITTTVAGNLTGDPELRFTPNGSAVVSFTVAVNSRSYDRQTGQWTDGDTSFVRCTRVAAACRERHRVAAEGRPGAGRRPVRRGPLDRHQDRVRTGRRGS